MFDAVGNLIHGKTGIIDLGCTWTVYDELSDAVTGTVQLDMKSHAPTLARVPVRIELNDVNKQ